MQGLIFLAMATLGRLKLQASLEAGGIIRLIVRLSKLSDSAVVAPFINIRRAYVNENWVNDDPHFSSNKYIISTTEAFHKRTKLSAIFACMSFNTRACN